MLQLRASEGEKQRKIRHVVQSADQSVDVMSAKKLSLKSFHCLSQKQIHTWHREFARRGVVKDRECVRNSSALKKPWGFCVLLQSGHTACGVFAMSTLASHLRAALPWTAELLWHTNMFVSCMVLSVQLYSWHTVSKKPGCYSCLSCRFDMYVE